ncbi:MAG: transposase [Planctomycetes bacterium]|nr:transposase [Planctomycetota bacterium]
MSASKLIRESRNRARRRRLRYQPSFSLLAHRIPSVECTRSKPAGCGPVVPAVCCEETAEYLALVQSEPHEPDNSSRSDNGPKPRCRHREIIPGETYLLTKKCLCDLFLIRPSKEINAALRYLLALKAKRYRLKVHHFCMMSNHFHLLVTDPEGRIPDFMREFLHESSKAIQAVLGERLRIWDPERYGHVRLLDLDAKIRLGVYTELNPLIASQTLPEEWPGLTSARYGRDTVIRAERPNFYFSKRRPEVVELELVPFDPSAEDGLDAAEIEALYRETYDATEAELLDTFAKRNVELAGVDDVLAQPRTRRGSHTLSELNPRYATRNPELMNQAVEGTRQFESDFEAARKRWLAGHRRAVFPHATYGYRVTLGVRVAARGTAA